MKNLQSEQEKEAIKPPKYYKITIISIVISYNQLKFLNL